MTFRRRSRSRFLLAFVLALAAGCDRIPMDPEDTLERVRSSRQFRVGLVAGSDRSTAGAHLGRIAAATGASPVVETGSTEALLVRLEKGTFDLVIGEFDYSSPWSHRVTFVPTLAKPAGSEESIVTGVAARNGENGWIRLVHEQATGAGARR